MWRCAPTWGRSVCHKLNVMRSSSPLNTVFKSYRLLRVVFLKELLCPLLSSVSEEHDDLVTVCSWHILENTEARKVKIQSEGYKRLLALHTTHMQLNLSSALIQWFPNLVLRSPPCLFSSYPCPAFWEQLKLIQKKLQCPQQPDEGDIYSLSLWRPLGLRCHSVLCYNITFKIQWKTEM